MKIAYTLKRPNTKGRKTFAIIKDERDDTGKRTQSTLKDSRVESINALVEQKLRDVTTAEIELRAVIEELYAADRRLRGVGTYNDHNQKLLEAYWLAEYEGRDLSDKASAKQRLQRAVDAVGLLSISSASRNDLEKAVINAVAGNANLQRNRAAALNQLLAFVKRSERIRPMKEKKSQVRHIDAKDLPLLSMNAEDSVTGLLYTVLFATGARLGECITLKYASGKSVYIDTQYTRKGDYKETKTRNPRHAYILPGFGSLVAKWSALPMEKKKGFQEEHATHHRRFKRLTLERFDDPIKQCTLHDLRHSYAIHLIQRGVSLTLVAQALGNSVTVCERYYSGFILRPEGVEMIDKTLRKK